MSDFSREHYTKNRNLQDLRVTNRQSPVLNSLALGTTSAKVLDIPNFSFDDNLFPGSPCPNENLIGMHSPHLYEVDIEDVLKKNYTNNGGLSEQRPAIFELDPLLEDSVNISDLIESQINEEDLERLIFEGGQKNIVGLDTPYVPADQVLTTTNLPVVHQISETINSTPLSLSEIDFMTTQQDSKPCSSEWQIVTIKTEDLGTSSCQLSSPIDDSVSSTSVFSPEHLTPPSSPASVSSTPTTPTVIQRGRPGRKPSGNGPVRNSRKRKLDKESEEYKDKRNRNNVAVRKSRDKAKEKQKETEERVTALVTENEGLQKKVELLSKELQVLKSLFINVGAALPANFEKLLAK